MNGLLARLKDLFAPLESDEEGATKVSVPPQRPSSPAPAGDVAAVIALALDRYRAEGARTVGRARAIRKEDRPAANDGWVVSGRIEQVNRDPRF